jgi:NTE family protein
MTRALVLSGGGFSGAAWIVGLIEGLRDRGIDLGAADLTVGTSGGARTGVQLATGALGQVAGTYRRGGAPPATAPVPLDAFVGASMRILAEVQGQEGVRRIANLEPLGGRLGGAAERRAVIAAHLPVQEWPEKRLAIVAVDAETGSRIAFEAGSGVPLLDAVTASGALPGIYPLVPIDGRRYADGGAHSWTRSRRRSTRRNASARLGPLTGVPDCDPTGGVEAIREHQRSWTITTSRPVADAHASGRTRAPRASSPRLAQRTTCEHAVRTSTRERYGRAKRARSDRWVGHLLVRSRRPRAGGEDARYPHGPVACRRDDSLGCARASQSDRRPAGLTRISDLLRHDALGPCAQLIRSQKPPSRFASLSAVLTVTCSGLGEHIPWFPSATCDSSATEGEARSLETITLCGVKPRSWKQ